MFIVGTLHVPFVSVYLWTYDSYAWFLLYEVHREGSYATITAVRVYRDSMAGSRDPVLMSELMISKTQWCQWPLSPHQTPEDPWATLWDGWPCTFLHFLFVKKRERKERKSEHCSHLLLRLLVQSFATREHQGLDKDWLLFYFMCLSSCMSVHKPFFTFSPYFLSLFFNLYLHLPYMLTLAVQGIVVAEGMI